MAKSYKHQITALHYVTSNDITLHERMGRIIGEGRGSVFHEEA